jgi:hypothetical protein
MSLFRARIGHNTSDRRASARVKLAIPARLRLTTGDREGQLVDMSQTGARITVAHLPPLGAPAILLWGEHEVFCKIVWTEDGTCGLRFDRPLTHAIVIEATGQDHDLPELTVANRDNIPMGQKRSRLGNPD